MRIYVPNAGTAYGVVQLDSAAGPGGLTVTLVSDTPAIATVPANIFLAEGTIAKEFLITYVSDGDCIVTASYAGINKTADVTCVAAGGGGTTAFCATLILGTGTLTADMTGLAQCASNISGTGTVTAQFNSLAYLSSAIQGSGTCTPALIGLAQLQTNIQGTGTVTAPLGPVGWVPPYGTCGNLGGVEVVETTIIIVNHVTKVRVHLRSQVSLPSPVTYIPDNDLECIVIGEAGLDRDTEFSLYTLVSSTTVGIYYHYVVDCTVA